MTNKYEIGILFLLMAIIATECTRVNFVSIPRQHVIKDSENPEDLLLDCDYFVDSKETGFVLQWEHDEKKIYEWIPPRDPWVAVNYRDHVDTTYEASDAPLEKHRALLITTPTWNMTGEYTCSAQTHQTGDKKSGKLTIIDVTQTNFELSRNTPDDLPEKVEFKCTVENTFPQPKLGISVGDNHFLPIKTRQIEVRNGTFDVTITSIIDENDADNYADIECLLMIPESNYTMSRSFNEIENGITGRSSLLNIHLTIASITLGLFFCRYQ